MTSLTSVSVSGNRCLENLDPAQKRQWSREGPKHESVVVSSPKMFQNFLEFVLLKEQVDANFTLVEKRVNFLFDVNLKREENDGKLCWLKVEGNVEDIQRAKDYVIAVCSRTLCSLEEAEFVWNNTTSSTVDSSGTKQTPSVVEIKNEECNRDHKSQQDISSSETVVSKKPNQADSGLISRTENANDSPAGSEEFDKEQECAEVAKCEGGPERTADTMVVNRNVVNKPSEIVEKAQVREDDGTSDPSASGESLRDFAKKLGYAEDTIATGLSKLGPSADTNSLLSELVKAQSSVKQLEEGSSTFSYEKPLPALEDSSCLRPIVIDGSNVAMSHGTQRVFSCQGIGIVVDWFLQRNHRDIKVFVPKWREKASRPDSPIVDQEVLKRLEQDRLLVWTPSRTAANGRIIKCYDDRYIIKHAAENDGVIVSNDNFRDLMSESHEWKKVIEQRLLMYTFVDDKFMPPDDPLGRHGPTLDEFLKKGCGKLCPYLRNCTYGKRCRFLHPDRNPVKEVDPNPPSTDHLPPEIPYGQVSRPTRPLPPCPPEVPPHTRPLPSVPADFCQKPLPLPPREFPAELARVFPPTLRTGQAVGVGQRRSDPTPLHKQLPPEVQIMQERFQRTHSMPSVQEHACGGAPPPGAVGPMVRRGSVPHVCHPPPPPYSSPSGPPEVLVRGASMPLPRVPNESDWMLQEQMFAGHPYQYPPHFSPNPPPMGVQSQVYKSHPPASLPQNHWNLPPYPQQQQHPQYPAAHQPQYQHYGPVPPGYCTGYGRTPYHGQRNGYFRSRAPPIIGGTWDDVTDDPKDRGDSGSDSSQEELRIQAYDKLCELFPDDVEKVLKILDKYSDETSVETLTEHMLDDTDD